MNDFSTVPIKNSNSIISTQNRNPRKNQNQMTWHDVAAIFHTQLIYIWRLYNETTLGTLELPYPKNDVM